MPVFAAYSAWILGVRATSVCNETLCRKTFALKALNTDSRPCPVMEGSHLHRTNRSAASQTKRLDDMS